MKKLLLVSAVVLAVGIFMESSSWVTAEEKEEHGSLSHGKKVSAKPAHVFAGIGNELICPVMGGKLRINKKTTYSEYKGKSYAFCCPGCKPLFDKDSEKHAGKGVKSEEHKKS